jgi:thioredoxin-dependent peroxiredoxin
MVFNYQWQLPDQTGDIHNLLLYKGKWIVLFAYPKDNTPGCTEEVCSFQSAMHLLQERGVVVLGISGDTARKHSNFAKKYSLTYPLLADRDCAVIKQLGAYGDKRLFGREYQGIVRTTWIFNPKGKCVHTIQGVVPAEHASKAVQYIPW